MAIQSDVIIVGGGLSGLALADHLQREGISYQLFEAHSSLGGRIKVHRALSSCDKAAYDLGPSWLWPGQVKIRALVDRFNLEFFEQFSEGLQCYEDESGAVHRGAGYASMQGSYRLRGGMITLVDHLYAGLDSSRIHLNAPIASIRKSKRIEVMSPNGLVLAQGERLVLAIPPRVAESLEFTPKLNESTLREMLAVPTWMAGQAKFCAIYEKPFWRAKGLSGDAMSRVGPLAEIHDATDPVSNNGALFGFVGVPPDQRKDESVLVQQSLTQLARVFGPEAMSPLHVIVKDWAADPNVAVQLDRRAMDHHPTYGMPVAMSDAWGGQLLFSSSEMSPNFGGYLEGALEAAESTARLILA